MLVALEWRFVVLKRSLIHVIPNRIVVVTLVAPKVGLVADGLGLIVRHLYVKARSNECSCFEFNARYRGCFIYLFHICVIVFVEDVAFLSNHFFAIHDENALSGLADASAIKVVADGIVLSGLNGSGSADSCNFAIIKVECKANGCSLGGVNR